MKRTLHAVIICLLVVFLIPLSVSASPADPSAVSARDISAADTLQPFSVPAPFYGIWCSASKNQADVQAVADRLSQNGFPAQVLVTTDWDNLNTEFWYVVTSGLYPTETSANADLAKVQTLYPDAYVKYSGNYKGSTPSSGTSLSAYRPPFFGIWCSASKDPADEQAVADRLSQNGFPAQVLVTTDWDNLNTEFWYVVTSGLYTSEASAYADLAKVQALYPDAYVKYSGNYKGSTPSSETSLSAYRPPFYGIWCSASKDQADEQAVANRLSQNGFPAQVLVTTDWDNLNTEFWYVVTSGLYTSEASAYADLAKVQALYPDAYVKYSGNYKGSSSVAPVSTASPSTRAPFYGIWCSAAKNTADVQATADKLSQYGFPAQVMVTTDWSNLNPEFWYVLTAGTYASEDAAYAALPQVQAVYPDAYVKYSGDYIGG